MVKIGGGGGVGPPFLRVASFSPSRDASRENRENGPNVHRCIPRSNLLRAENTENSETPGSPKHLFLESSVTNSYTC